MLMITFHRATEHLSSITRKCVGTTNRFITKTGFEGTKFDLTARRGKDFYYFPPQPYCKSITPTNPDDYAQTKVSRLNSRKVSVIGVGQVGLGISYALVNQGMATSIALVDMNKDKLEGEADDMIQGSAFHNRETIVASTDYSVVEDSSFVVVTAGVAQQPGESRLALLGRNVKIMQSVIPNVIKYAPDAVICIASNPCDILTAVASKIAGPEFPPGRIFGAGTHLDTGRLRTIIGNSLNVDPREVNGYIIGEHGDSSVPAWSTIRVGGIPVLEPGQLPNPNHDKMHRAVVDSAYDVIRKKGYTNWAIGLSIADIAKTVLEDQCRFIPVSTCVRGFKGVEEDVYLSLPSAIGVNGINHVQKLQLTDHETKLFVESAKRVWEVQSTVWDDL